MNPRFVGTLMFVIIIACLVAGAVVYPYLPATFVSHWGIHGEANGTMDRSWGVLAIPIIMLVLVGLWALLPRIDPIAPGFKGFRYVYDFIFFLIISFFAYAYALMLGINAGLRFNMLAMILPALAALIFILGVLLPYLKRNWFVGIRTPWTISSDAVWEKTQRLGGALFEVVALFIMVAAFTTTRAVILWLIVVPSLLAAVISVVYSYFLYHGSRQEKS